MRLLFGITLLPLVASFGCAGSSPAPERRVDVGHLLARIMACLTAEGALDYDLHTHVITVTDKPQVHEQVARIVADCEQGVAGETSAAWTYRVCGRANTGHYMPAADDPCRAEEAAPEVLSLSWRTYQRHGWIDLSRPKPRRAPMARGPSELHAEIYRLVNVRPPVEDPCPPGIR